MRTISEEKTELLCLAEKGGRGRQFLPETWGEKGTSVWKTAEDLDRCKASNY